MQEAKQRFLSVGECMVEFARSANAQAWSRNFAGDTFNTAWYFHHLTGADWTTAYFTAVGDDKVSDDMCTFMAGAGIDTDDIRRLPDKSPGLYTIDLDGAERSFCYWRENSAARKLATDREALASAFSRTGEIYFSGITIAILSDRDRGTLVDCLGKAKAAGASISFDPNIRPKLWAGAEEMKSWLQRAASVSTRAFPTFPEEADFFGEGSLSATAERYRGYGVGEVVVKNGEHPCLVVTDSVEETVPVERADTLVDTTGAGDSFNGGYLAARVAGIAPGDACRRAHRLSARVVSAFGALLQPQAISEYQSASLAAAEVRDPVRPAAPWSVSP